MNKNNKYYDNFLPQTAFRDNTREMKAIDLSLPNLENLDEKTKKILKEKIVEEDEKIVNILLPIDLKETIQKDGHLERINQKLGIN